MPGRADIREACLYVVRHIQCHYWPDPENTTTGCDLENTIIGLTLGTILLAGPKEHDYWADLGNNIEHYY